MRRFRAAAACALALFAQGCGVPYMADQARHDPLSKSDFFKDQRSARPIPANTVARGHLREDDHLYKGRVNGAYAAEFPFPVTQAVLNRGRERYDIHCAVCHDRAGYGRGMAVQRGFPAPTSYHSDRMRGMPPGYFFDVMTNGFGRMQDYADQVSVEDRWAIAAYVRVLQLSQNAALSDVPADQRAALEGSGS